MIMMYLNMCNNEVCYKRTEMYECYVKLLLDPNIFYVICWRGGGQFLQGITVCLVSSLLCTVLQPGNFRTVGRDQVLVFFNRHSITLILVCLI